MINEQWAAVDQYICDLFVPADAALDHALQTSADAGLPAINVAPNQGKFLHMLARIHGARNILEIGTLGGYSTLWLAKALPPGGRLVTLEFDPKHAEVARRNFEFAGLAGQVDLHVGLAMETLPNLVGQAPFDFVFIDADKINTADYFMWALRLSRKGSVIIVDNVIRDGAILDQHSDDPGVQGVRRFNDLLTTQTGVTTTAIQTVGSKGYDGFAIVLVTAEPQR